jgi:hypothetical protein
MGKIVWSEKKTNNEVLKQVKMTRELFSTIRKRQMKFFGHIKRHNNILKDILEGKIQGKRSRSRQRLKWTDNIKRWTGESLAVNTIKSRNRVEWRSMVANLRCGDGTE